MAGRLILRMRVVATYWMVLLVLACFPSTFRASVREAERLEAAGRMEQAVERYQEVLEGNEAEVCWRMSRALVDMADEDPVVAEKMRYLDRALEVARCGVEKAPDSARAHAALAVVQGKRALLGSIAEKIRMARVVHDHAERARSLNPDYHLPYVILGAWHREVSLLGGLQKAGMGLFQRGLPKGDLEKSASLIRQAIHLEPGDPRAHYELALTLLAMDRPEEAERLLEQVAAMKPDFAGERQVVAMARRKLESF